MDKHQKEYIRQFIKELKEDIKKEEKEKNRLTDVQKMNLLFKRKGEKNGS